MFVPTFKAKIHQGLMYIGFYQPKIEKIDSNFNSSQTSFWLTNQKDEAFDLSELQGNVVIINFWATWCAPCLAELPSLQKLSDKVQSENIKFILVEIEANQLKAYTLLDKLKVSLPLYFPKENIPSELFQGTLPTTVIFDKNGNLVFQKSGMANFDTEEMKNFLIEISHQNTQN